MPIIVRMKAEADPNRVNVPLTSAGWSGNVNSAPKERLSGINPVATNPKNYIHPLNRVSLVLKYFSVTTIIIPLSIVRVRIT